MKKGFLSYKVQTTATCMDCGKTLEITSDPRSIMGNTWTQFSGLTIDTRMIREEIIRRGWWVDGGEVYCDVCDDRIQQLEQSKAELGG